MSEQSSTSYTVVAAYIEPPQIYCETVEAASPEAAVEAAWEVCRDSNGWDEDDAILEDTWADVMVITGTIEVVY